MIVLCDIDHTISDARWRDSMIGNVSWDEYHKASVRDKVIEPMRDFLLCLQTTALIVGLTTRPIRYRQITMKWMYDNRVPMNEILMRDDEDYRPAPELKMDLAVAWLGDKLKEAVIIDDRDDVCAAFCAAGVVCLQTKVP